MLLCKYTARAAQLCQAAMEVYMYGCKYFALLKQQMHVRESACLSLLLMVYRTKLTCRYSMLLCFAWRLSLQATQALPFGTIVILILIWLVITFPLTVLGGWFAKNSNAELQAPCRYVWACNHVRNVKQCNTCNSRLRRG